MVYSIFIFGIELGCTSPAEKNLYIFYILAAGSENITGRVFRMINNESFVEVFRKFKHISYAHNIYAGTPIINIL